MTHPSHAPFARFATLALPLLGACAGPSGPPEPASDPIDAVRTVLESAPVDQVLWGIHVVDAESDRELFALNAARKFVPASNMKMPVTAAALALLGPDFVFETPVWTTDPIQGGIVRGDLVVTGWGDPTLSSRFYESADAALDSIASGIRASGVRAVEGDLVIDATWWDSTSVPSTWMAGNLGPAFGAVSGPFAIEEGVTHIEIAGTGDAGGPAEVRWWPLGEASFVESDVTIADPAAMALIGLEPDVRTTYLPERRILRLEGTVERGSVDTLHLSTRVPVEQAGHALLRRLRVAGIEVGGELVVRWSSPVHFCGLDGLSRCLPDDRTELHRHRSPTLDQIAKATLEPSQNWIAEQLLRTLGGPPAGTGSAGAGVRRLDRFLVEDVGVDSLDFSFRDGSGLSAYNVIAPRALTRLLTHLHDDTLFDVYRDALAAPGEEDSTLDDRLLDLEGRIFAKTGTISNVNALSGYLVTDSGRTLVFSILTNGSGLPSNVVRQAMDDVVRALSTY